MSRTAEQERDELLQEAYNLACIICGLYHNISMGVCGDDKSEAVSRMKRLQGRMIELGVHETSIRGEDTKKPDRPILDSWMVGSMFYLLNTLCEWEQAVFGGSDAAVWERARNTRDGLRALTQGEIRPISVLLLFQGAIDALAQAGSGEYAEQTMDMMKGIRDKSPSWDESELAEAFRRFLERWKVGA